MMIAEVCDEGVCPVRVFCPLNVGGARLLLGGASVVSRSSFGFARLFRGMMWESERKGFTPQKKAVSTYLFKKNMIWVGAASCGKTPTWSLKASISTSTSDNFLIRKLGIWGPGVKLGQSWGRVEVWVEGRVAQLWNTLLSDTLPADFNIRLERGSSHFSTCRWIIFATPLLVLELTCVMDAERGVFQPPIRYIGTKYYNRHALACCIHTLSNVFLDGSCFGFLLL